MLEAAMAETTTPRPSSRRMPRDQRVATIMETARAVFREKGSEQFLPSEVAERCGISEGTIYKYFPTKRDLLSRVAEEWFEEFIGELVPYSARKPIRDRLFHIIWSNLELIRREKTLTRFVLLELRPDPGYRNSRMYALNRRIAAQVTSVIADGVAKGELRADLPIRLLRDMIFGCIEHQTWAFLRGEGDFSAEDSAEGITDVIYRGIAAPARETNPQDGVVARLEAAVARLEQATQSKD